MLLYVTAAGSMLRYMHDAVNKNFNSKDFERFQRGFWSFQVLYNYTETMSSVNSAACLLARNHFYQNVSPMDKIQPVYSFPGNLSQTRQRQVNVWKTSSSYQGLPGQEPRRWVLSLVWKSPLSSPASSKRPGSADRVTK